MKEKKEYQFETFEALIYFFNPGRARVLAEFGILLDLISITRRF